MSLLTLIQGAADRIGLRRPTTVINNTSDKNAATLLGFAQQEGKELARRASWQKLTQEATFATANGTAGYDTESDFDWYINDTIFNRTQRRRLTGPLSNDEWQLVQSSLVNLVNPGFRFRGGQIVITPTPTSIETIAYEYVSKNWCESSSGTDQVAWAADDDVGLLDEELMTLGVVWRFRQAKGFDYSEQFRTYETQVAQAIIRDGAKPRLSMVGQQRDKIPIPPVMPETLAFS